MNRLEVKKKSSFEVKNSIPTITINKPRPVFLFVSIFISKILNEPKETQLSKAYILISINRYLKDNNLVIERGTENARFKITNEFKFFFDNCAFIASTLRNQKIIVPEILKVKDILKNLRFCFVINEDKDNINNIKKIFNNIFPEDIINNILIYLLFFDIYDFHLFCKK
jgi:hypothetical protein